MPTNRIIDFVAHRNWRTHRTSPAYMRGMPSWLWQSALAPRRTRPRTTTT